jgi:hypothetical protein
MWYSNVVIELFQIEFSSPRQSDRYVDKLLLSLHFALKKRGTVKLKLFQIHYQIFSSKFVAQNFTLI